MIFSDLTLDAALEEGHQLNELSLRPEHDRTFSVMSKKPLFSPMMETIKPYRDKLIQAKRQLDEAWNGETASQPVVTSSQPDDVHELRENLSRVSNSSTQFTNSVYLQKKEEKSSCVCSQQGAFRGTQRIVSVELISVRKTCNRLKCSVREMSSRGFLIQIN